MIEHLRSMAVFAKVIDHGSFRAAAKALQLSPSVVSHHVSQLEQQLGVTLLYRSTRKLSLTDDGRAFHQDCRKMLDAAETGLDRLADHTDMLVGELRIAVPAFLSATLFMEDAAAFANAHPKVRLNISFNDQVRDLMAEGFDLGLRINVGPLPDSSMRASKLLEIQGMVCASPRYLADRRKPKVPSDLLDHPWVIGVRNNLHFHSAAGAEESIKVQSRIKIDSAHAARGFALQHIGLTVLPEALVDDDFAQNRLVEVLPTWRLAPASVYALWPPNAGHTSLSFRFVDFLRGQIALHTARGQLL